MFKHLDCERCLPDVEINVDGHSVITRAGTTLAIALLQANCTATRRHPVSKEGRAPYCLMGACFECLVEVDGQNVQSCQIKVRGGMRVKRPGEGLGGPL